MLHIVKQVPVSESNTTTTSFPRAVELEVSYVGKQINVTTGFELEVFKRGDEILFHAIRTASGLGYAKPQNALAMHCKHAIKLTCLVCGNVNIPSHLYSQMGIILIDEGDLYTLVMKSQLKAAHAFQQWVCREVIPTIRKTGSYSIAPQPNVIELPTDYKSALKTLVIVVEMNEALMLETKEAKEEALVAKKKLKRAHCRLGGVITNQRFYRKSYLAAMAKLRALEKIAHDKRCKVLRTAFFCDLTVSFADIVRAFPSVSVMDLMEWGIECYKGRYEAIPVVQALRKEGMRL